MKTSLFERKKSRGTFMEIGAECDDRLDFRSLDEGMETRAR
jgi:hypothetical protein